MNSIAIQHKLTWRNAGLGLVFAWFMIGGVCHFTLTNAFVSAVPSYVPFPREIVLITGVCELVGALALLSRRLRALAGIALCLFCVCVTPVHIEMLQHAERYHALTPPLLWARLFLQPIFIAIIWFSTQNRRALRTD